MGWSTHSSLSRPRTLVLGLALFALLVGVLAVAPQDGSAAAPPAGQSGGDPIVTVKRDGRTLAKAREFWTPERMRQARPVPRAVTGPQGAQPRTVAGRVGSPADSAGSTRAHQPLTVPGTTGSAPTGTTRETLSSKVPKPYTNLPDRTNGKLFIRAGGSVYVCSATAVNSRNKSLVWTAGHCVSNGAGRFFDDWLFVPAYSSRAKGSAPYGKWSWSRVATPAKWHRAGNLSFDLAAIVVQPRNGKRLVKRVGGQGIAFNRRAAGRYTAFGYPAARPFNGFRQWRCISRLKGRDTRLPRPYPMRITCNMTGGSSGGGWLRGIRRGLGTVHSVVSYGPPRPSTRTFGPYQGALAKKLYRKMRGVRP